MMQSMESVAINEEQNLSEMRLFKIRDLTQLVLWFQSTFVIFQLTCCCAAATSVALC